MYITKRTSYSERQADTGSLAPVSNEGGAALIIVMIVLVVLTLLGVIATRTTQTELKIAASDKRHRMTFYDADGATELASELLEQNIELLVFDDSTPGFDADTEVFAGLIGLEEPDFWRNGDKLATTPTDADRDFFLPWDYDADAGEAHTNFTVGGHPEFMAGSSLPMAAGYEGLGKKSGSGGTKNVYEIITQRVGDKNSESIVRVQWRHVN